MILLETILYSLADLAVLLFEYCSVGILVFSGIQGILNYMRKEASTRLILGKGIAMALEFLLGSSVLRILMDPTLMTALAALILLFVFAGLSILIHFAEKASADNSEAVPENVSCENDPVSAESSEN